MFLKETDTIPTAIGIAASAGGLNALSIVLAGLEKGFPAVILVVQHLAPNHKSLLSDILSRRTTLEVKQAEAGEYLKPGCVFIAPPNYHMLVNIDNSIALTQSELVHFVRPSADLLFESLAGRYKEKAIAVVLTGTGIDGSLGVTAIKKRGGTIIVQDPEDADFDGMPMAAIQTQCADHVLPLDEIAAALRKMVFSGHD